ncbi:MAG: tRNA lysidine(34) synthetase TilS [Aureisphaera sp.]
MQSAFVTHINNTFPSMVGKKVLVACSGGLDSMVLSSLLYRSGFDIALAHCNFGLRGRESDEDEVFVHKVAQEYGIQVFVKKFDTEQVAKDNKWSIQMTARELRYQWFHTLLINNGFEYLVTAHHADDDLETFFINLSRGTGIRGLRGIPMENDKIIRPLLAFTRSEIEAFAKESGLYWREDSSNEDTKYLRNQIRHDLIPAFKGLGDKAIRGFRNSQKYLDQGSRLIEDYIQLVYKLAVSETNEGIVIDIARLDDLPHTDALLFEMLHPFGFTDFKAIKGLLSAQTGKLVRSSSHRIQKNRNTLLISEYPTQEVVGTDISEQTEQMKYPISLSFSQANQFEITNGHTVFLDKARLSYPLVLRKWNEGDSFYPLGMKGKKKLSKFFKDEKLSLVAKENCWLLCSEDQIVWVIGYRMDERFKVTKETKNIVRIDYTPN